MLNSNRSPLRNSFTDVDQHIPGAGGGGAAPSASVTTSGSSSVSMVAAPGDTLAVASEEGFQAGRTQGEVRSTDINIPKLTVVNPLSEARDANALGSILLAGEIPLAKLGDTLEFVVIGVRKEYEKVTVFGSGEPSLRAKTMAEVRALGGTLDRKDKSRVAFQDVAYITCLVPCPADADENVQAYFRLRDPSGRCWAKALYFAKSFGYTNFAKPVLTREQLTEEPHFNSSWLAETEEQKNEAKKTRWYQFKKLKAGKLTTPEFRVWAESKV